MLVAQGLQNDRIRLVLFRTTLRFDQRTELFKNALREFFLGLKLEKMSRRADDRFKAPLVFFKFDDVPIRPK